ncbi:MAG: acetyltransferase [Syntrophomonadaceae bacterium]|nr:acetyltransferase [Syntrophomonadaceae bacterium]
MMNVKSMTYKTTTDLVVVGAGGLGREVVWLIREINAVKKTWSFIGLADDGMQGKTVEGYPIVGTVSDIINQPARPHFVVAIADSQIRRQITQELLVQHFPLATLVHPQVNQSNNQIGEGSIVCAGTILTTNVNLGRSCIVNPGCFIGHDAVIQDYVSLMPGAHIAGETTVGTGCFLGIGSTVKNRVKLGDNGTYGAGAVVINHMPDDIVAVGVPAKVIKNKQ